ncbi:FAD binding domain-containing protein [Endogone sp. FLAS-F59071]|nr:FAD binding domain-containing protein [Endogone sp. FLAS-F59071]|eukprot:RUS17735.1 FAD binding domain-containing protein [Endogone sp. FLAS-F59071]
MNQASSTNSIIDVLIVGAGPVGLLFANEMQKYGCSFRIIDKNETRSVHSKALGVMSRTLEALDNRGLLEPFLSNGFISNGTSFRSANKQLGFMPIVGQNIESPFPYSLIISQVQTEQFLEDALRKASLNDSIVERSVTLLGYEESQDTNEVVARLARLTPEGEPREEVVRAKYIVGCDGVHSAVRKGIADWLFEGHSYKSAWALADLTIRSEHIKDNQVTVFLHPEGPVAIIPFPSHDGKYRLVTSLGDFAYDDSTEVTHGIQDSGNQLTRAKFTELTLEELRDIVARRVAEKLVLTDPVWLSTFRINERIANGYRRGRAFIAGDAAHCHSPAGAQGMNMGLQDAHNLAWKLALVLKGKVNDVDLILDSYSAERRPIAAATLKATGWFTKILSERSGFADLARTVIAPLALKLKSVRLHILYNMLGLGINYTTSSPLNHPTPYILCQSRRRKSWLGFLCSFLFRGPRELIEPGTYHPDGVLKLPRYQAGCDTLMLHDVLRGTTTHTLILFSRDRGFTRSANPMVGRIMKIAQRYKSTIKVVVVTYFGVVNQRDIRDAEECVADGTFAEPGTTLHERVGVPKGSQAVVVIRPDMYIAFSAVEEEIENGELEKFLGGYLVEDAGQREE